MAICAVVKAGRGLVIVRQSLESMTHFRDLRGESWAEAAKRHASAEVRRLAFATVEEAADLRSVARVRVWSPEEGEFSARWIDNGEVLTTWRPLTQDEIIEEAISRLPPVDLVVSRVLAIHGR